MSIPIRTTAASLALLFASLVQAQAGPPQESSSSSSWKPLFDGHSLDGWDHVGPGKFVIEDGMLRTQGGMGLLWYTREKLGDCVIRVIYKTATPRANSGIYIRIADRPRTSGMRSTTATRCRSWTRALRIAAPARSTRSRRPTAQPAKTGEWNTLEVTLKGDRVRTAINGVPVAEFDPSELKSPSPRTPPARATRRGVRGPGRATSGFRITTRDRWSSSRRSRFDRSLLEDKTEGEDRMANTLISIVTVLAAWGRGASPPHLQRLDSSAGPQGRSLFPGG